MPSSRVQLRAWVFKGTRVPVRALFENLEAGATVDQFLAAFLEHEDMFVARAARDRLGELKSPEAKRVLRNYWDEVKRMVRHCVQLLRTAGREATVENELNIRIQSGPIFLNWEALYSQKRKPDFDDWVIGVGRDKPPNKS